MAPKKAKTINGVLNVPEEVEERRRKRLAYGAIAKKTNLRCRPCNRTFHNLEQKYAHLQGRAHKICVERAAGPYLCIPCGLQFPLPNEHKQHLASRAHLQAQVRDLE